MGRLADTFDRIKRAGSGGLVVYVTAGDPSIGVSEEIILAAAGAGADVIEIGVQVNGKARGRVKLAKDAPEEVARAEALKDENVAKFVGDKPIRKFVYVPGRIVNFIVG